MNTSAYVADPTQWVDPLGLNKEKGNKGLFWLTPEAQKASTNEINKMSNNSNKSQKTNLAWNNSPDGRKYIQPVSQDIDQGVRHDFPIPKNQKSSSLGMIGTILPGTMSGFAKDQNNAKLLKNMQGMRNVGNVGAAVALSPYAVAYAGTSGGAIYSSASALSKTAIESGGTAATLDLATQTYESYKCNCNKFDAGHVALTGVVGGVTGGWGGFMSKSAGVKEVGYTNLYKSVSEKNWQGVTIFGAAEGMAFIGDLVIDESTGKTSK